MSSQASDFTSFGEAARSGSMGGIESWGTDSNAQTDNATRARYSTTVLVGSWSGYTKYLKATQLANTIPSGATVDGIEIKIQRRKDLANATTWADSAVYIMKSATIQTTQNKAVATAYTSSDVEVTYGSSSDLWGLSWSDTDINGSGFGVVISCAASTDDSESHDTAEIDYITAIIYYTSVNNYTLSVTVGSFTLTGNATGLTKQSKTATTVGVFTLTGNDVSLSHTDVFAHSMIVVIG